MLVQAKPIEGQQKPTIKNSITARLFKPDMESSSTPSKTVPNQTLTVRQIMARYAKGLPLGVRENVPMYTPEDEQGILPENWDHLDPVDQQEWIANAQATVDGIKTKLKGDYASRKKKRDAAIKAAVNEKQSPNASQFTEPKKDPKDPA